MGQNLLEDDPEFLTIEAMSTEALTTSEIESALAATILAKRKSYYDVLEAANKDNEITPWISWFAATAIEAQQRMVAHVEFLIARSCGPG